MPGESLRDQLQAVHDEIVEREAAATPPETHTPETTPPEALAAPEGEGGPARNDKGQFAPKDNLTAAEAPKQGDPPAKPVSETTPPEAKEPVDGQAIRVPPSLPAAVKAKFGTLDSDVQQAFAKLEETVQTAKAEWGKKGERLNRFEEIFAPRREKLQLQGLDDFQAVQTLFAAQDFLERDPMGGISYLARSYGVNLQSLAQQTSGQFGGAGAQQAPAQVPGLESALKPLIDQVQTLHNRLAEQDKRTESEKMADAQRQIAEFAGRPENLYWEDVKFDVATRLQANPNLTLAEAYDQAAWASPTIRPLLLQAQAQAPATLTQQPQADAGERQRQIEEAARRKADDAKRAGGSVTGAPQGGAQGAAPGSTGNLRADLEAAWAAHAA